MRNNFLAFFVGMILTTNAFALFCPNNFNSINIGDSQAQIEQVCGKADSQSSKEVSPEGLPQEWGYFVSPPDSQYNLKVTVAFDKDKVINISVNGASMNTTSICNGASISVGDSLQSIKSACGKPAYVNQSQAQQQATEKTKITELKYGATTLVFENGKLKSRK